MSRLELVELATLCLITNGEDILMQNRTKEDWKGYTLPGGHVELEESILDSVKREIKEETGLDIINPKICGDKQFPIDSGRYIVVLFKADQFQGTLSSSDEGEVKWIARSDLYKYDLVDDFFELLEVFENENINEFIYKGTNDKWEMIIK